MDDAIRLSPPALARLIARHRQECRQGAVGETAESADPFVVSDFFSAAAAFATTEAGFMPSVAAGDNCGRRLLAASKNAESGDEHFLTASGKGGADAALASRVSEAVAAFQKKEPIRAFCIKLGRISHLAADLNNPFHTAEADMRSDEAYEDFSSYAGAVAERAPLVFYGWRDDLLQAEDLRPFALEIARRSAQDARSLRRAYYPNGPAGRRVSSTTFDDRSVPFAVASLSYSRAVSDTANLWLLVWNRVGGDLRATPYRVVALGGD